MNPNHLKFISSWGRIIFFVRESWDLFHIAMALEIRKSYPQKEILFASFSSRALVRPNREGFPTIYFPDLLAPLAKLPVDELQLKRVEDEIQNYEPDLDLAVLLSSERFAPENDADRHHFCWKHVALLDQLIQPETLAIYGAVDHYVYWLANVLVNARAGAFFGINICGIPARTRIMRDPWTTWEGPSEAASEEIFLVEKKKLDQPVEERLAYMNPKLYHGPSVKTRLWRYVSHDLRHERRDAIAGSYFSTYKGLLPFVRAWIQRRRGRKRYIDYSFQIDSLESILLQDIKRYFFVGLHLEPEATILMYSPWMKNQLELCQNLSRLLPTDAILLVKDNPKMREKRDHRFYSALKELPNVRLVAPWVPAVPIIKKAEGVITLAGNASLEAALLGVPAITMGRPPFARILGGNHFATKRGLRERDLRNWLHAPVCADPIAVKREWARWLSGTIPIQVFPNWDTGEKQVPVSLELIDLVFGFMSTALEQRAPFCQRSSRDS